MQSQLEPGKCPICGDRYFEKLMLPDGTEVRQIGTSVLASDKNLTVHTNYRDSYIVLSDLSLTRVSYCEKHNPSQEELLAIFELTRSYAIDEQRAKGGENAALQVVKWQGFEVLDVAQDEMVAIAKLETLKEAALVGDNLVENKPIIGDKP